MKIFPMLKQFKKSYLMLALLSVSSQVHSNPVATFSDVDISPLESDINHTNYYLLQTNHVMNEDVTFNYTTRDGTAKSGEDYIATSGTATIPVGEAHTLIGVEIIGDTEIEGDEYYDLLISNPSGEKFLSGKSEIVAKQMILDDDLNKQTPNPSADFSHLPRITINDLKFVGGFRIDAGTYGESRTGFSDAKMAYNKDNHSIFLSGFNLDSAIAEFPIPDLVISDEITDLTIGGLPLQDFSKIFARSDTGNIQYMNKIGGMEYVNGELLVHAYEYYDGPANNTHTSVVVRNPSDLANSNIDGFFEFGGKAHGISWISPLPTDIQPYFGGDFIMGSSNSMPINRRSPMGPSAFVFSSSDIINTQKISGAIDTIELIDFDLEHILSDSELGWLNSEDWHGDVQYNYNGLKPAGAAFGESYDISQVGSNHIWTEGSGAQYGIVIPGTRTYAVFGYSTMHNSGGGYKIMQQSGHECGGPCAYDPYDKNNYYWFFDVADMYEVKQGNKPAHEVKPYAYGVFDTPYEFVYDPRFGVDFKPRINGGAYNAEDGIIYFSLPTTDKAQSVYEPPPVFLAYKLELSN